LAKLISDFQERNQTYENAALALVGILTSFSCWAVPIVSNVQMKQIEGTKDVRITYDLADNFNTQLWVTVVVQPTNSVANWGTGTLPLKSVDGDAMRFVAPGRGREIVWHAGDDWNGRYTLTAKAIVSAIIPNDKYEICPKRNLVFSVLRSDLWYPPANFQCNIHRTLNADKPVLVN